MVKRMSDTVSQVHKKKDQEKVNISWGDIEGSINNICHGLLDIHFDYIYGIPRGGLIPAVMMSHTLNIPLLTDITKHNGKKILIVDDINDSGQTLRLQNTVCDVFDINAVFATLFRREGSKYAEYCTGNRWVGKEWLIFPWE